MPEAVGILTAFFVILLKDFFVTKVQISVTNVVFCYLLCIMFYECKIIRVKNTINIQKMGEKYDRSSIRRN